MAAQPLFPWSQNAFLFHVRSSDADIYADIYQHIHAAESTFSINSGHRRAQPETPCEDIILEWEQ